MSEDDSNPENRTISIRPLRIDSSGGNDGQSLELESSSPKTPGGDAAYKKALHDMLLLQFRRLSTSVGSGSDGQDNGKPTKSNRRYSV